MKSIWIAILFLQMTALAAGVETKIHIKGMTCPSCAASVERELKALPQVSSVSISLRQNTATVVLKEGQNLSQDQIKHAVEKAGYSIDEKVAP